jgi:hypothetical protein
LLVDTSSKAACQAALESLVTDADLRHRLSGQALRDICHFYPERPAWRILEALFGEEIEAAAAADAAARRSAECLD